MKTSISLAECTGLPESLLGTQDILWVLLFFDSCVLKFYGKVNTMKVMWSQSVDLSTLFLGRLLKWLTVLSAYTFASNCAT